MKSIPDQIFTECIVDGIRLTIHDMFVLRGYYHYWKNFLNEQDFREAVDCYLRGQLDLVHKPEFGDRL